MATRSIVETAPNPVTTRESPTQHPTKRRNFRLGDVDSVGEVDGECVEARFPPQQGGSWDSDKYTETAHDFLTARAENPITALFLLATGNESLKSLLYTAVLNYFRSLARQSERGKLLRRLDAVLQEDPRFTIAGDPNHRPRRWTLRGLEHSAEYTGNPTALRQAAWEAPGIEVARWRSATRTYISDRHSIVTFAEAVIEAACGPLDVNVLLDVAAHRFDLIEPPLLIDIDDTPALTAGGGSQTRSG